jgi:hypothetical protein
MAEEKKYIYFPIFFLGLFRIIRLKHVKLKPLKYFENGSKRKIMPMNGTSDTKYACKRVTPVRTYSQ